MQLMNFEYLVIAIITALVILGLAFIYLFKMRKYWKEKKEDD